MLLSWTSTRSATTATRSSSALVTGSKLHLATSDQIDSCFLEIKLLIHRSKHEKTHSRPFKCTELTCKYFQVGWSTEKERDRHINDRHSNTRNLYKCQFQPCTYASARESNCKQHMEKTHGWVYVRSRNSVRGGRKHGSSLRLRAELPACPPRPRSLLISLTPSRAPTLLLARRPYFPTPCPSASTNLLRRLAATTTLPFSA